MRTSEVLDRAADVIEQRGWTRYGSDPWGGGTQGTGPVCIEGGIRYEDCSAELNRLQEYLGLRPHIHLFVWNDSSYQTQEHVIETLRTVAEAERYKENQ